LTFFGFNLCKTIQNNESVQQCFFHQLTSVISFNYQYYWNALVSYLYSIEIYKYFTINVLPYSEVSVHPNYVIFLLQCATSNRHLNQNVMVKNTHLTLRIGSRCGWHVTDRRWCMIDCRRRVIDRRRLKPAASRSAPIT